MPKLVLLKKSRLPEATGTFLKLVNLFQNNPVILFKVDLIKIDCDSFELDILRGCIKTLWALSPVVVVELNSQALGLRNTHIGAVKHFLAEQGYSEIRQSEENSTFKKLL